MAHVTRRVIFPFAVLLASCSDGSQTSRDGSASDAPAHDSVVSDTRPSEADASAVDVVAAEDVALPDASAVDVVADAGPNCTGVHAPPAGLRRQTSFSLAGNSGLWAPNNTEWPRNAVLDLTTWNPAPPGQRTSSGVERATLGPFARNPGDVSTVEIETGAYISMRIDTVGLGGRVGALESEMPSTMGAPLVIAISRCPGDFQPEGANCRSDLSGVASIGWTTGATPATYCKLEPATTYYLNVMFAEPTAPNMSTCPFGRCWWFARNNCSSGC
ncbi:MAG: hypothetical protein JNK05_19545 [Myxococcales bacterium]|nr:hypothetical protein [Myxococcales bacterium]